MLVLAHDYVFFSLCRSKTILKGRKCKLLMHVARLGTTLLIHSVQFHDQLNGLSFLKEPSCRFNGTVPEPRKDVRGGHIPGSKSVPYTEVLAETSRFLYYHGILVLNSLMT